MKGIIYKATDNWTGRVYIGQTMTTLAHRRGEHLKDAEKGNDWNAFHLALFQRGGDFTWEVIDEFEGDKEFLIHALNVAEEYHILKYDSTNKDKGYNSVYGGYSADKHAAHIKAKLRTSYQAKAFLQYDLDGNFLREFASVREVASFLNCDHLNGSQIDTRRGHKWRGYQWRSKVGMRVIPQKIEAYVPQQSSRVVRVALYDIKGDFVKVFERYSDVEKELGYSPVLRDDFSKEVVISESRKGDFLCYRIPDGDYPQRVNTRRIEKDQPKPSQLVVCDCYDLDGKFVARYPSLIEAKRHTGVDVGTIRDWCRRVEPLKVTGNTRMLWRYGTGEIRPRIDVIPYIRREYKEKKEHRVLQYSLKGEYIATFRRIQEASDASGDSYGLIRKQCQGGRVRETKYQWRYYTNDYPLEIPKFVPIPQSLKVGRPRKSTYSASQQTLF